MADIDLATITDPISDDMPCGPDLDMEFDGDFMNFEANVGMAWPERYFSWDAATLKGHTYYDQIAELLGRSRDLRLLVPLAKLRILEGDIIGFSEVLDAVHRLLKEHWADVHPQPADFLELSMGQLSTLNDNASSVLPFHHARIVASRRSGPITYRKWMVATGEVNPREEEDRYDAGTLTAAIAEADSGEVDSVLQALEQARDAVAGIKLVCIQEAGYENAPTLDNLTKAIEGSIAMVEGATGKGDAPAAEDAPTQDGPGAPAVAAGTAASVVVQLPAGSIESREDAVEAMHAAAKYFAVFEPSSPVPMLLREAQNAASKSFYELVNDLMPDTASSAFVSLGREPWFEVSLMMLDQRNPAPDYINDTPAAQAEEYTSSWESAGLESDAVSEDGETAGNDTPVEDAAVPEEAQPETEDSWADFDLNAQPEPEPEVAPEDLATTNEMIEPDPDAAPRFVATSRPEAVDLMNKVLTYYRIAEPSSPVSLIIERALELSSKNFIELLGDVLPEGSLKVKPDESASSSSW